MPQVMAPQELPVVPGVWPGSRADLLFIWERGGANNAIEVDGKRQQFTFSSKGRAVLDGFQRLRLAGGAFETQNLDAVVAAQRNAEPIGLEFTFWPEGENKQARLLTALDSEGNEALRLDYAQGDLRCRIRWKGQSAEHLLGAAPEHGPCNLMLGFGIGLESAWLNGERLHVSPVKVSLPPLSALVFGASDKDQAPWLGRIEAVALYRRKMEDADAQDRWRRIKTLMERRKVPARIEIDAELKAVSATPELAKIAPYRNGLMLYEHEVKAVLSGTCAEKRIRVVHWGLIDGVPATAAAWKPGQRVTLILEPWADQKQAHSLYCSDDLPDAEVPRYFDTGL